MAIPDILATRLIELTKQENLSGNFLMLGRQDFIGTRRSVSAQLFQDALAEYLPGVTEDDLKNPDDVYADTFFRHLGYDTVDSLDFSPFESASIVQDLGGPLNPDLHNRFDVIYDGGVCEHVFDLPTAYRNIDKMLKPGGVFTAHSPCNNWINHAFYQIGPEIVYGFWASALGYEVIKCELQPLRPWAANHVVTMSNPLETGKRPRLKGKLPSDVPVLLNFAVRKSMDPVTAADTVSQTDYAKRWDDAAS